MSSTHITVKKLVLLLICKELVVESSDRIVGSLEVLLTRKGSAEGRGFAGLQDEGRGGQEAYLSRARRGRGIMLSIDGPWVCFFLSS